MSDIRRNYANIICRVDNIIPIVIYELYITRNRKFRSTEGSLTKNTEQHESCIRVVTRRGSKSTLNLITSCDIRQERVAPLGPRARRMIKSVEWTGEKIIKFVSPGTGMGETCGQEGTWWLPVIFIRRLECRQNPRPLFPSLFVLLSVSLLLLPSIIRHLISVLSLYLSVSISILFCREPRVLDARRKVDIQPWFSRGEHACSFICQPLRARRNLPTEIKGSCE